MKIAYLTNQYPHVRHTFIRREIVALESIGVPVSRYSVRVSGEDAVDPADIAEREKTRAILSVGKVSLLLGMLVTMFARPIKFWRAFRTTWSFGRLSDRGVLRHVVYLAEACLLRKWLIAEKVTHLHVHFATNPAVVAMLCEQLGGPSYSITIHGPEEWDRPEALSLTQKYEHAKFVVAVTDFGRCQVYRWTKKEYWPKVHVVHCGVDDGFLQLEPTPVLDTTQFVLVAGLVEQKGHLLLLPALQKVKQKGHKFSMVFVGDGHLRKTLEAEVERLELKDCVQFVGWRSNAEVREYLKQSRALVMPSFAENLPVAMMEALMMGRPVLGTYIAGVPELVEPGKNGWLVPAGNADLSANAIIEILQTPVAKLSEMGLAGAEKVRQNHNAKTEAQKMKQLFESIVS